MIFPRFIPQSVRESAHFSTPERVRAKLRARSLGSSGVRSLAPPPETTHLPWETDRSIIQCVLARRAPARMCVCPVVFVVVAGLSRVCYECVFLTRRPVCVWVCFRGGLA